MEFATLGDALNASANGDTIAVQAGTYTNDFGTVTTNVHIVAVGGMVNEVATVEPPNGKGILTVDNSLSIQGFTFSGGTDGGTGGANGSMWGNVAGIRLENGSLNVSYCYFHNNQNGILADADPTASVSIDHSEFNDNGSGDGYTHNIYIGSVGSLSVTNSYFHGAQVGHEIKSRALVTTITNNVIADGADGTASYDIDIPNAGVAKISGNIIEKGANASNTAAIHYGGETQYAYTTNSLNITNNTIINDLGATGLAVLNQSNVNGLTTSANMVGNSLYGFASDRIILGAGTETGDKTLTTEPTYSQASPWTAAPTVALASGPSELNLTNHYHTVTGGAGHLTVDDTGGSNTICGGSGGLTLNANAQDDVVTTQANAADVIDIAASGTNVNAAGNDRINVTVQYNDVSVSGRSTINSSTFDHYHLNGAGERLNSSCSSMLTVGGAANASVVNLGGDIQLSMAAGATLLISDQAATVRGGVTAGALVTNGAVTGTICNSGLISLVTGASGARVQAMGGAISVAGGAGPDTLIGGTGTDTFSLGGGADQVAFGSGTTSVTGGTGADTYVFHSGAHGTATITGFKQGVDTLRMVSFSGTPIASGSIVNGSTLLSLADGTTIDLVGVVLPGYGAPASGGTGGGGGAPPTSPPSNPPPASGSGTVTLTTSGQTIMGSSQALTVSDLVGGNTIGGGSGGLSVTASTADLVSTAANASNTIALYRYDTLNGGGSDQVTASANGNIISESGTATVTLLGTGNVVQGGSGQLVVTDSVTGNTVAGGAGGIVANMAGAYDSVTTAAGASDSVTLGGQDALNSAGTDQITVNGNADQVTVSGTSSIVSGTGSNTFDLLGTDSMTVNGAATVTVGQRATVTIASAGNNTTGVTKLAGGTLALSESLPGGVSSVDVTGGAATVNAGTGLFAGLYASSGGGVSFAVASGLLTVNSSAQLGASSDTVTAGGGNAVVNSMGLQGVDIVAGGGNVTLNGGAGNDVFAGGAGQAQLNLGSGLDTVSLGNGAMTVHGGVADTFVVPGSADGNLVVQNWTAQDSIVTPGQSQPAIAAETVLGGSTFLTMVGGAHIELVGVTHFT